MVSQAASNSASAAAALGSLSLGAQGQKGTPGPNSTRRARRLVRPAVVHPVEIVSLMGAVEAAKEKLIVPVLVGPEAKIRAAAEQAKPDLSTYELVPTEHSHAAAAESVALARDRKVEALAWVRSSMRKSCTPPGA